MRQPRNELWMFLLAGMALGYVGHYLITSFKTNQKNCKKPASSTSQSTLFDSYPIPTKPAHVTSNDFLIVANGNFAPRTVILQVAANRKIVALDGAADRLITLGIMPHIILGDFDSIADPKFWGITQTFEHLHDDAKSYFGNFGITIIPAKDQNLTDLSKAIRYCDKFGTKRIDIICANGGRADHDLGNIRTLRVEHKSARCIYYHTDSETLQYVKDDKCEIKGEVKESCGILAFPAGSFTATGLAYPEYQLNFGYDESSCNQLTATTATVTVTGEAIIVMPGLFAAQKQFKNLTHSAKLAQLWSEAARKLVSIDSQSISVVEELPYSPCKIK